MNRLLHVCPRGYLGSNSCELWSFPIPIFAPRSKNQVLTSKIQDRACEQTFACLSHLASLAISRWFHTITNTVTITTIVIHQQCSLPILFPCCLLGWNNYVGRRKRAFFFTIFVVVLDGDGPNDGEQLARCCGGAVHFCRHLWGSTLLCNISLVGN